VNEGRPVFAQLVEHLPSRQFRRIVGRYEGNRRIRSFSCWDQFLCMAFAQITYREGLRDIEACLRAQGHQLYHLGIRGRVSRSTLADANERRDWRIYADFAQKVIVEGLRLYTDEPLGLDLDQSVYALDSTTIDLCLSLFPWARFSRDRNAVKLHTLWICEAAFPQTSGSQEPPSTTTVSWTSCCRSLGPSTSWTVAIWISRGSLISIGAGPSSWSGLEGISSSDGCTLIRWTVPLASSATRPSF
jgi:hypothetical protein